MKKNKKKENKSNKKRELTLLFNHTTETLKELPTNILVKISKDLAKAHQLSDNEEIKYAAGQLIIFIRDLVESRVDNGK